MAGDEVRREMGGVQISQGLAEQAKDGGFFLCPRQDSFGALEKK